jgi:hypothetical protein
MSVTSGRLDLKDTLFNGEKRDIESSINTPKDGMLSRYRMPGSLRNAY